MSHSQQSYINQMLIIMIFNIYDALCVYYQLKNALSL